MRWLVCVISFMLCQLSLANDGAFYLAGNQLVPQQESDIALRKEVLTIKFIPEDEGNFFKVDVDYVLHNPGAEKTLTVGFEALPPRGDVDLIESPIDGAHPYMRDFSVTLNQKPLDYQVRQIGDVHDEEDQDARYVYYFTAHFAEGDNHIHHSYFFDASGSVEENAVLDYVLTAANRWANGQIDDFTLELDMGIDADFYLHNTFFADAAVWQSDDAVYHRTLPANDYEPERSHFYVRNGRLIFEQKNFRPQGELHLYILRDEMKKWLPAVAGSSCWDGVLETHYAHPTIVREDMCAEPNELEKRILRNLPFAQRGYVFKNSEAQRYFDEQVDWYLAIPDYQPDTAGLTPEEQAWVVYWREQ